MSSDVVKNFELGSAASPVSFMAKVRGFIQLTKPRIVLLFGVTGLASMLVEGSLKAEPLKLWMVFIGIVLTAGSANAINQYIDRDIDAVMKRTKTKRPIPAGILSPKESLIFAIVIGILATGLLYYFGNLHAAFWGVFTIAFYIGVYTMWLKRSTPYNIVIGGAAGATAPLIGWAAATGSLSLGAWIMFLVIFMWTPAHFWALALCIRDEYAGVSVPMLPVVKGEETTRRQIFYYTVATVPLAVGLFFTHDCGMLYAVAALALGAYFLKAAWRCVTEKTEKAYWHMFGYSIVYLLLLFSVMILDSYTNSIGGKV